MVAKTLHAVGFKTESGLQFLVHLGIDTVELEGKPFTLTIAKGDEVKAGQNIGTMDVEAIKEGGKDTTTVVTVTNTTKKLDHIDVNTGPAEAGDKVAVAYVKAEPPVLQAAPTPKELTPAENPNRPAELTGYDALAWDIIDNIGGKENVRSVTYCITRVRFYLKDTTKAETDIITNLNGVRDVVQASGQYQVVVGPKRKKYITQSCPNLAKSVAAKPGRKLRNPPPRWIG